MNWIELKDDFISEVVKAASKEWLCVSRSCPYMVISVQNEQVLSVPYIQNMCAVSLPVRSLPYMVISVQNEQAFSKTECPFNYHIWWSQSRMNRVFQKHNVCYLMSIYGHSRPEWTGFSCPVRVKYQSRMNRLFQKAKCVSHVPE